MLDTLIDGAEATDDSKPEECPSVAEEPSAKAEFMLKAVNIVQKTAINAINLNVFIRYLLIIKYSCYTSIRADRPSDLIGVKLNIINIYFIGIIVG